MDLEFKVGDNAVYPAHGVGIVKGIESREISGSKHTFYILKLLGKNMTVMVPTGNAKHVGLRGVITKSESDQVFKILRKKDVQLDTQTWNRRYREYMEKIKTGSIYEIAEVLRDLYLLRSTKELSFGERKMMDTAQTLLIKEVAIACGKDEDKIQKKINAMFTD